jgi:hypothetical protein
VSATHHTTLEVFAVADEITIHHPPPKKKREIKTKVFFAYGDAIQPMELVGRILTTDQKPTGCPNGTLVAWLKWIRKKDNTPFYRWVIKFVCRHLQPDTDYIVQVSTTDGQYPAPTTITIKRPGYGFGITYPNAPEDITDYADGFVAYGPLEGDYSVNSATMSGGTPAVVVHAWVNNDWESETWTAMFPSLDNNGSYTLDVSDSYPHPASQGGLTVNRP